MAHFRYIVSDVDQALVFYCEQLGFELIEQYGPAMAIIRRDDLELWLAGPVASASKPMPDGAKPEPGGWNRCVLVVDDIKALVASLREQGAIFRNDITTGPGGKQILCEDPSGNVVELFQPG
ncbi:VOC family protein [Ruegeria atlantica]|uniref:VOC family protein n=1 Tax=Ruegeria atlantica TaxID=81569 RepID=UPI001480060D|nr:VOC family protein [Ruegeria atlantica]